MAACKDYRQALTLWGTAALLLTVIFLIFGAVTLWLGDGWITKQDILLFGTAALLSPCMELLFGLLCLAVFGGLTFLIMRFILEPLDRYIDRRAKAEERGHPNRVK
jgi:hypothetical protein